MKSIEQTVIAAVEKMTTAFHDSDLKGVMASYEPSATVAFEPGEPVSDREAIEAGFQGFFSMRPRFEYGGHEVLASGDVAVHFAPWKMSGTGPDGAALEMSGLSVAVLRKQPDGSWRIIIDNPYGHRLIDQMPG